MIAGHKMDVCLDESVINVGTGTMNWRVQKLRCDFIPLLSCFFHFTSDLVISLISLFDKQAEKVCNGHESLCSPDNVFARPEKCSELPINVIGSPLKLNFLELDTESDSPLAKTSTEAQESESFNLGSTETFIARWLMSVLINSDDSEKYHDRPYFVACAGNDHLSTVLLGFLSEPPQLTTFSVFASGPFRKSDLMSLDDIFSHHGCTVWLGHGKFRVNVVSSFNLIEPCKSSEVSTPNRTDDSSIGLCVVATWDSTNNLLQNPPLDAAVTVKVKPGWKDSRSPVYSFCKELLILENLYNSLSSGKLKWPISQREGKSLKNSVEALVSDTKNAMFVQDNRSQLQKCANDTDVNSGLLANLLPERTDFDFSELLWNALLSGGSIIEVIEALQIVLQNLRIGAIQPLVHKDNETRLACIIRDSFFGRMENIRLDGLYALELVTELGIEKIKRDFIFSFCGGDLVTLSALDPFVKRDPAIKLGEQIDRLKRLYQTLEALTLCKAYLGVSQPIQCRIVRTILEHYADPSSGLNEEFNFSLVFSDLQSNADKWAVSTWQATFDSDVDSRFGERSLSILVDTKIPAPFLKPCQDEVIPEEQYYVIIGKKSCCGLVM